jgi:hypothetical protein
VPQSYYREQQGMIFFGERNVKLSQTEEKVGMMATNCREEGLLDQGKVANLMEKN